MAPFDPYNNLRDAPTFSLSPAHITTDLFKKIVGDLHVVLNQYGPPQEHTTLEAKSKFIAPVSVPPPLQDRLRFKRRTDDIPPTKLIDRIVAQFNLLITNLPESVMSRRMAADAASSTNLRYAVS